jgi:hypothetical protein
MPHLSPQVLVLIGALFAFSLYRRVRRHVGRQPVQPYRLRLRIGVLALIAGLFMFGGATMQAERIGTEVAGLLGGAALAWFGGLRLTRFERDAQGSWYTPNLYIGLALTALFLGRMAYRFVLIYPQIQAARQAGAQGSPLDAAFSVYNGWTLALFGLMFGYYLAYYAGVLLKSAGSPERQSAAP